jgi:molecular chaperone GrpE
MSANEFPDPANGPFGENPADQAGATKTAESADEITRQRDDYLDQLRRKQAEFVNYQKRAQAQAAADRQFAVAGLAIDVLAVLDNFERALQAARNAGASAIVEGLEMVEKQLLAALVKNHVEPIDALGKPFDPHLHEAILQQPKAGVPEGTVVAELGKGYKLHDRVLRPSKVAVSVSAPDA